MSILVFMKDCKLRCIRLHVTVIKGAFFWNYSGIGILVGINGICVLLGAIPFSE